MGRQTRRHNHHRVRTVPIDRKTAHNSPLLYHSSNHDNKWISSSSSNAATAAAPPAATTAATQNPLHAIESAAANGANVHIIRLPTVSVEKHVAPNAHGSEKQTKAIITEEI